MASKSAEVLKARWIAALRSGEYQQGNGNLRQPSRSGLCYCCLGVLCEVAQKRVIWVGLAEGFIPINTDRAYSALPPSRIIRRVGMSERVEDRLAEMNDGGKRFSTIATWIETHDLATGEPLPKTPTKKRA